jgi:hypothetical protein
MRKEGLTLYGGEGGSEILANVRAENSGAFPSYTVTSENGTLLGSLRARSFSLLTQERELVDAAGVSVGAVTTGYRRRRVEGAATRLPIVGRILKFVEVLDTIVTIEIPAGTKVLEARYVQALSGHRFEVRQLGEISPRDQTLILPSLAILLRSTVHAARSG